MRHSRFLTCLLSSLCVLGASFARTTFPQAGQATQSVKLNMIVINEAGQSVDDIRQEEIEVVEEKRPLKVSLLVKDERAVKYAITIDVSGSFKRQIPNTMRAVRLLIESNRPADETMLIRFVDSSKIEMVRSFTEDKDELLKVASQEFLSSVGQTAFIDAAYVSAQTTSAYKAGDPDVRHALILISDGEDRSSFYSSDALMKLLREKDVQVFILGVVSDLDKVGGLIRRSAREKAEDLLERIAEETGGRVFFPKNEKKLLEATAQIIHDLHAQYLVGFERPIQSGEKRFRKARVRFAEGSARKKLKIITRPGYWLPQTQ